MWGVSTVRGASRMGESAGSGSEGNTSIAAPAMRPARSASASAARSMISPRAAFTRTAVGFILAMASASISPRVRSVSGACSEITSAAASSSSSSTRRAPMACALASVA